MREPVALHPMMIEALKREGLVVFVEPPTAEQVERQLTERRRKQGLRGRTV